MTARRLHRSSTQNTLLGVAGGLGEYFDVDPVLVRIGFVFLGFATAGCAILLYLVLAIVMPRGETSSSGPDVTRDNPPGRAGQVNERGARQSSEAIDLYRGGSTLALALIVIGAIFLCAILIGSWWSIWSFNWWFNWGVFWPVSLLVLGVVLLWRLHSSRTG